MNDELLSSSTPMDNHEREREVVVYVRTYHDCALTLLVCMHSDPEPLVVLVVLVAQAHLHLSTRHKLTLLLVVVSCEQPIKSAHIEVSH